MDSTTTPTTTADQAPDPADAGTEAATLMLAVARAGSLRRAAALLGVSPRTLRRRWAEAGLGPAPEPRYLGRPRRALVLPADGPAATLPEKSA